MESSKKIRVAVLYGGRSAEHEISLRSAANVIDYLDTTRFEIIPVGIDKQGNWFLGKDVFAKSLVHRSVPKIEQSTWFTAEWVGKNTDQRAIKAFDHPQTKGPIFDVVFPVVHGSCCEDGSLQGLLELSNIPYVGAGVLSSAIGMDKDVSKRLASMADILVAPYIVIKNEQWQNSPDRFLALAYEKLTFPLFVKPANTGSSIGVNKVHTLEQLQLAIKEAFRFDVKVIVEKALNVLELEVAVLESLDSGAEPIVSVVGEIKPRHEFYTYQAKCEESGAELLIPASVSDEIKEQARMIAKQLFIILECEGMARIDLFYNKETQQIVFNEINTIPGFTQLSMYPKLMEASGVSYTNLLTHLIQLALKRHQKKSQLIRHYPSQEPVGEEVL